MNTVVILSPGSWNERCEEISRHGVALERTQ